MLVEELVFGNDFNFFLLPETTMCHCGFCALRECVIFSPG